MKQTARRWVMGATIVVGVGVGVSAVVTVTDDIQEWWWLRQFSRASGAEQGKYAKKLASVQSVRAIPGLFWEVVKEGEEIGFDLAGEPVDSAVPPGIFTSGRCFDAIVEIGPSGIPFMLEKSGDREVLVRWAAMRCLWVILTEYSVVDQAPAAECFTRLTGDENPWIRSEALYALMRCSRNVIDLAVRRAIEMGRVDPVAAVREQAVRVIQESEFSADNLSALMRGAEDPDVRVRRASTRGIGVWGSRAARALSLLRRVRDSDSEDDIVRYNAEEAIERIGG